MRAKLLIFVLSACGLVIATQGFAGETRNGGVGFVIKTESRTLDELERGDEFRIDSEAPDFVEEAYRKRVKLRMDRLQKMLPRTIAYLADYISDPSKLRWYFSQVKLSQTDDEGDSPLMVSNYRKVQLAVNFENEVFIDKAEMAKLNLDSRAFLLMHEILWVAAGQENIKDGEVIRRLASRFLSPFSPRSHSVEGLGNELQSIIQNAASPLYRVISADIRANLAEIDGGEATAGAGGRRAFLRDCTMATVGDEDALHTYRALLAIAGGVELDEGGCDRIYRKFTDTEEVSLASRHIVDVSPLRWFKNFRSLNLRDNDIVALDALAELPALRSIDLYNNEVESLEALSALTRLRELNVKKNNIEEIPKFASQSLVVLDLDNNYIGVGGADLGFLSRLPNLESLKLGQNRINSIVGLKDIEAPLALSELYLYNNHLSELDGIEVLKNLVLLDVSSGNLQQMADLRSLDQLHTLKASNNEIATFDSNDLPDNLVELDLSANDIEIFDIAEDDNVLAGLRRMNLLLNPLQVLSVDGGLNALIEAEFQTGDLRAFYASDSFGELAGLKVGQSSYLSSFEVEGGFENLSSLTLRMLPSLDSISWSSELDSQLATLSTISIVGTGVTDLAFMSSGFFAKTATLDLTGNANLDIASLPTLPTMTWLRAQSCSIESIADAQPQPGIVSVDFSKNLLVSSEGIDQYANARGVSFEYNRLDSLEGIEKLEKIEMLQLFEGFNVLIQKAEAVREISRLSAAINLLRLSLNPRIYHWVANEDRTLAHLQSRHENSDGREISLKLVGHAHGGFRR